MNYIRVLLLTLTVTLCTTAIYADSWRDKTPLLIYSPRYFGPNAFPIPEVRSGISADRFEVELRGQYHYYSGDKTKDLLGRILIPVVKGRAGVEATFVFVEDYKMTPATRDERNAVETESPISCHGDVILNAFFQVLRSDKWVDIMANMTFKTASGNRLCDARYTDAGGYWFDVNIGKTLLKNKAGTASLRMQGMAGFYCWMTNSLVHRQNDAILYGGGFTGIYRGFSLSADLSGFYGYKNNGDRPLVFRSNLKYEYKKNIISFRYNHGMKDYLYDDFSVGYIRCF